MIEKRKILSKKDFKFIYSRVNEILESLDDIKDLEIQAVILSEAFEVFKEETGLERLELTKIGEKLSSERDLPYIN